MYRLVKNRINLALQRVAVGVLFGVFAATMLGGAPAHATTGINQQINYQARLLNTAGATVADGSYNIEFKIYSGGTGCVSSGTSPCGGTLLWTEDWLNGSSQGVTVTNGYFSVMLGAGADSVALDSINFNQTPLWLSINIGDTGSGAFSGDGEMLPFTQFAAAPYAFNSEAVGGVAASALAQLGTSQTFTGANVLQPTTNITAAVIKQTSAGSPTADIFNVQTAGSAKLIQATSAGALVLNGAAASSLDASGALSVGATNATSLTFGSTTNNASTVFNQKAGTTAFQVLPASGSTAIIDVDSTSGDNRVGINTNAPSAILDVEDQNTYAAGVSATTVLNVLGGTGGSSGTPGIGGAIALQAGVGGNKTTGSTAAGTGGAVTITGGTGGTHGAGTGTGGNGGNVTINGGAGGAGGVATNGSIGTVQLQATGGLTTLGGGLTFTGTAADVITGPSTGGLTVTVASGPLALSTTTSGALSVTSAGALNLSGAAASTWDIGANTLSLQTTSNGAITTGTGTVTVGGQTAFGNNVSFSGSTARTITGPGAGGLTITDSTGSLNLTGGANSTWDLGASHTLSIQTTNNGAITTGSGQLTVGGALSLANNITFSGSTARTITGPSSSLGIDTTGALNLGTSTATSLSFGSVASNTSTTFKQTSSTTAFQIQNASSQPLLTVDTSANQVVLGYSNGASGVTGQLAFSNSGNNNKVSIASGASSAAYSLLLPVTAPALNQCLQNNGSTIGQLIFSSCGSGGSGVTTVGTFSGSSQVNGATISGTTITFGPADGTNPGLVSTGTQTFAGAKTFSSTVAIQGASALTLGSTSNVGALLLQDGTTNNRTVTLNVAGLSASYALTLPTAAPGTGLCLQSGATTASLLTFGSCAGSGGGVTTVGTFSGSSQANGATISGSTITFGPADTTNPGLVSTGAQTFGGAKTIDNGSNTTSALTVQQSGNPTATLILAKNTNASPTGNLIDLQAGSTPTSQFSVSASGLVTAAGNFQVASGNKFTSAGSVTLSSSGSNAVNIDTGSGGDINIAPANAADVKVGKPFILTDAGNAFQDAQAPTASTSNAIINLGSSFSGSSSGTFIGVNAASGYGGDLINLEVNGTSQFAVTGGGTIRQGNGEYIYNTGANQPPDFTTTTTLTTSNMVSILSEHMFYSDAGPPALTLPTASNIIAAIPNATAGDTFEFTMVNGTASNGLKLLPNGTAALPLPAATYLVNAHASEHIVCLITSTSSPAVSCW